MRHPKGQPVPVGAHSTHAKREVTADGKSAPDQREPSYGGNLRRRYSSPPGPNPVGAIWFEFSIKQTRSLQEVH